MSIAFTNDYIEIINSSIPDAITQGGKKLRSSLMQCWQEDLQLTHLDLAPFAQIGELVHNATLYHDDVIDHAQKRRGHDSLPKLLGNKRSVLYGDYTLAKAMYSLVELKEFELVAKLSVVLKELVDGELIQMDLKANQADFVRYKTISHKKTGSLLCWFIWVPVYFQSREKSHFPLVEKIAHNMGEIYQVVDDTLDFSPESGKDQNIDQGNDNINFVNLMRESRGLSLQQAHLESLNYIKNLKNETIQLIEYLFKRLKREPNHSLSILDLLSQRTK